MADTELISGLKENVRGQVVLPGEPDFDSARTIWNAMIDRRPAAIVRCAGVADVIRSVNFARDHRMVLSVRGGGHNIAGNAVCEGGLMIDLSPMRAVHVNPETRRAFVEPGAVLADFDHEAQAFGLATPLGINSTTGVAGLTLGGGFGWLTRKYGLTIDNLIRADVITADGKRLRASAQENPDLFWAIRGGGGNFGVVTMFEFQLHPVGPELLTGLVVYPFAQANMLLARYSEFIGQAPEEVSALAVLRKAPPLPFLPADVHGKEVVIFPFVYIGDAKSGRQATEPLRRFAEPIGEHIGVQPYAAWQKVFDPLLAPGARNYWKSHNFADLSAGAIDVVTRYAATLPDPQCEIFIGMIGGAANRVARDAMAYAQRDAKFVLNVHGRWAKREDDERCIAWAREFFKSAAPHALGGVYVNFLTQDEVERIPAAYGPNYARLVELKNKFDPANLFCLNQNIRPTA